MPSKPSVSPQVKAYFSRLGASGDPKKKSRGDSAHYSKIGRAGGLARAAKEREAKAQALLLSGGATVVATSGEKL